MAQALSQGCDWHFLKLKPGTIRELVAQLDFKGGNQAEMPPLRKLAELAAPLRDQLRGKSQVPLEQVYYLWVPASAMR